MSPIIEINVNGLGGQLCFLQLRADSSMAVVKMAIAQAVGMCVAEQVLIHGEHEVLSDFWRFSDVVAGSLNEITVIRRNAEELARDRMQTNGALALSRAKALLTAR